MPAITSSLPDGQGAAKWFPSWFPWLLFCLTSAYRVHYVLQPKNWWMMHPDEVYQALEVAHSEMYGYGFRAYEYNPPAEIHPDTPHIRKLEREHGMAALRSYLLPHAYVTVTWLLELVGLQFNPYLTWKVAHTVAASTLSLAVYRYVRIVFRSHDTACLAAILCVTSAQLHALGTHTLVNSALSAPVFWALSHLHTLINPQSDREGNGNQNSAKCHANSANPAETSLPVSPRQPTHTNKSKGKQKYQKTPQKQRSTTPGSSITHRAGSMDKNGDMRHDSRNQNDRAEKWDVNRNNFLNENKSGVLTNTLPKTSSTLSKSGAEYKVTTCHSSFKQKCGIFLQNVLAGFVVGVCVYIRVDIAALVVFTLLPFWSPLRTCYIDVIVCAFGTVFGLVVGVMDDFWCYGWGIMTPYNWFRFNVERDYSSLLFGKNDFHQYIFEIFFDNVGIMGLSAVCCVCGVVSIFYSRKSPAGSSNDERSVGLHSSWRSSAVRTFISWMLLLALYSSKGHKEMRFAHNVIVLILITWASLLQVGVLRLSPSPKMQKCALAMGVALFAFSQWYDVSHLTDSAKRGGNRLAFKFAGDTQDINQCLYYLSSRSDVTGVVLDRNLYATGGYTLLHKDVPVFTIFGNNFLEFRKEDRMVERAKNFIGPQKSITVAYVGKFSNYITAKHSQYVFKFVLQDPRYNYFIALNIRDFSHFGLGESIHSCRSFKVYRRPAKPSKEQKMLMEYTLNLPPPSNGTILLHEADMLLYYGAWTQARDRFHMALKANPNLVGAYLPLAYAYASLGDMVGSSDIMDECYAKFGAEKCETKRPPLIDLNQFEFGASL